MKINPKTLNSDFLPVLKSIFARGTVGTNSLLSFASLSMQFTSNAVLVMILARLVDVSVLGEILYAIVFSNIAVVIASYGFENLIIREISQKRYSIHVITVNLLVAKLALSTVLIFGIMLFIRVVPIPLRNSGDLWFYFGASLINSYINSLSALRKGRNDFSTDIKVSLFSNTLLFVITLSSVFCWGGTTLLVGQIRLLTRIFAFVFAGGLFLKRTQQEESDNWGKVNWAIIWALFVKGLPFGLQAMLGTAYFQLDVIVLGALKNSTEVGFYQSSMQLISAMMLFPNAITNAYYPRLAEAFLSSERGLLLMRQMMKVLIICGLCFTAVFGLGAPLIITIFYGAKMSPSIQAMRILSMLFLIRSAAGGIGMSLMAIRQQKITAWASLAALITNLSLNLWLIPTGGFVAVAWINLFTNFLIWTIYFWTWGKSWKIFCSHSTVYAD